MIYDHSKPHNLADEQLYEVYSGGDRGHDDAGSEVDSTLSNASLRPLADLLVKVEGRLNLHFFGQRPAFFGQNHPVVSAVVSDEIERGNAVVIALKSLPGRL
jgi:hypothetical protein